ncbi:NAD-dependent epimerase/dehydratase family protein [Treponema zioleckii]|uniref:NAD-dependent epimerase/dehydratase family protein n=1 Tax=Treponema zioleckii TaxID=331680 RepID=UPI00168A5D53|nr:NAD(P)-dependent oxidoreductase [Treponema zioleckii]
MKKLILTGATGMIGSAIVREALRQDYDITCIVRKNSSRIKNIPQNSRVHIIDADISEYKNLELKEKYDIFMHLAWNKTTVGGRDDVDSQLKNIEYTLAAVRLAKRCGCNVFIGAGSQAEYGVQTVPLTPELPVNPESGYGIAKYTAGKLSSLLCKQLGIRFNWMRILSVYGKNDGENTLISYCIRELKNGRSPELTKCEQIWDYLNCDDAARAFLAVAEKGIDGKFYPLGSGNGRKLSNYMEDIQRIVNPDVPLGFGKKEYYPHQPMYLVADVSELNKDTGWKAEVEFKKIIREI